MVLSARYGTHLAPLIQAIFKTDGSILELGMGAFSTPLLHSVCNMLGRECVSIDNDERIVEWAKANGFCGGKHTCMAVPDWDMAHIGLIAWAVALVDHSPDERRVIEIQRLALKAKLIVVHDANDPSDAGVRPNDYRNYHYETIYPLFRYRYKFDYLEPATMVLSNFMPLDDFWARTKARGIRF